MVLDTVGILYGVLLTVSLLLGWCLGMVGLFLLHSIFGITIMRVYEHYSGGRVVCASRLWARLGSTGAGSSINFA